ncbi:Arylsulfatase [Pirellulimonas nuda]|uniref:Arylsulfatase n=2 Tax=Pirellulimonas nuda TaxID=2528009 RepID=A0A518DC07_9BACT|nr:Arylsulfatase [Pirellulimonas nuda]
MLSAGWAAAAPPNIVFIFSDDHAFQAVGAYGSNINQTPNIDRIANSGMRFDRCYVTNSICGPSRACILTGKYSHKNGFRTNNDRFDASQPTFAKQMQGAGYQTAMIGKWHLVSDPVGFDHWDILPGQGRYYSPEFITPAGRNVEQGYVTDVITDKALAWLKNDRQSDRPFVLMMQHKAPHRSWEPGPEHVGDGKGKTIPEPETLFDDYQNRSDAARTATMRISQNMNPASDLMVFTPDSPRGKKFFKLTPEGTQQAWSDAYSEENAAYMADPPVGDAKTRWNYQRYLRNYLACVARVDDSVGRVLDYLDQSGLAENTIVIYCSDQGFYLGEHGWYDKRFMYEQSLRTPLLVRWPGVVEPGSVCEQIASNVDLAETFLDAAGLPIPKDMQGRSLTPLLQGETPDDWRKTFYYHYYEGPPAVHTVEQHCGVTDGRYKLIHFYTIGQWELFDLQEDPNEIRSVYDDPAYAGHQERLKKELKRLQTELEVPAIAAAPLR